ncbi:hypothetical protein KHA80_07090 [Anaerobacillus sp. HL2]|nr:hypothetical protein KHA80_07090 [Anaerobacillus sp. HL2]
MAAIKASASNFTWFGLAQPSLPLANDYVHKQVLQKLLLQFYSSLLPLLTHPILHTIKVKSISILV